MLHGDTTQKGIAYQKAAKSVREAPKPIKSKDEAQKLVGVGRCVGVFDAQSVYMVAPV